MRNLHRSVALGLPTLVCLAGTGAAAPAAGPAARPASPTQVLAKLAEGGRHGEMYLANGPNDALDTDPAKDRTLAPYLYVAGGDPET